MKKAFTSIWQYVFHGYKYGNQPRTKVKEVMTQNRIDIFQKKKNIADFDFGEETAKNNLFCKIYLSSTETDFLRDTVRKPRTDIFHLKRTDLFQDERYDRLLVEGVAKMKTSIDPAHGWAHVRRVLQMANLLWEDAPNNIRPDWGMVLLAVIWHDVARVDGLGPAEDTFPFLKYIPFGQDFSILWTAKLDAPRSTYLLKNSCKKHNIPASVAKKLAKAISSTSNSTSNRKRHKKKEMLQYIVQDSDMLDFISAGRMEDMFESYEKKQIDKKFLNRFVSASVYLMYGKHRSYLVLPNAKTYSKIVGMIFENHLKVFYPKDYNQFFGFIRDKK